MDASHLEVFYVDAKSLYMEVQQGGTFFFFLCLLAPIQHKRFRIRLCATSNSFYSFLPPNAITGPGKKKLVARHRWMHRSWRLASHSTRADSHFLLAPVVSTSSLCFLGRLATETAKPLNGHQKFCPCANAKGREHSEPPGATNQNTTTQPLRDLHVHLQVLTLRSITRWHRFELHAMEPTGTRRATLRSPRARHSHNKAQQTAKIRSTSSCFGRGAGNNGVFDILLRTTTEQTFSSFSSSTPGHGNAQHSVGALMMLLLHSSPKKV